MSAALERQFTEQQGALPGSAERRREALAAFVARGFPSRREEAWRYTDLKPIAGAELDFAAPLPSEAARAAARALLDETAAGSRAPRAVLLDGRFDEALSRLGAAPEGLEIVPLATSWEQADRTASRTLLEGHPLALINSAFAADGLAIKARAGARVEPALELLLVGSGISNLAQQLRISIELDAGAALTVTLHCLDAGEPTGWLNLVVDVVQHEGSRLTLHRLQEHAPQLFHTSVLAAELRKDAFLELGYVDLGGRLARNDIDLRLAEPGASAALFGVFLASSGQHVDQHVGIEHLAPYTRSDAAFRGIADRDGRGVFNGKVLVHRDAQRIEAHQRSDNLLLAEQAEIDTKPELEIYADDVKCSHGATVGELDLEQLFYLRSRGLDEQTARALLTFAFANSVLQRIEPRRLRERATSKLAGQLPDHGQWEDLA